MWKYVSARRWPEQPRVHIEASVTLKDYPYVVSIVFAPDDNGVLDPLSISAARTDAKRVSPRDIQRLPLGSAGDVAQAFLSSPGVRRTLASGRGQPWVDIGKLQRVSVPHRKSPDFYARIAKAARDLKARGFSPAAEIARVMSEHSGKLVPRNRVDQWLHVARTRYGYDC